MAPVTFSVSEVRVAATCPRISYFDAEYTRRNQLKAKSVTRIWKAGDAVAACGSLFHGAVEAFNKTALDLSVNMPIVTAPLAVVATSKVHGISYAMNESLETTGIWLDA